MNCYACGHPIGYTSFREKLFHVRKGSEFSTTCWQCNCRKAVLSEEDEKKEVKLYEARRDDTE